MSFDLTDTRTIDELRQELSEAQTTVKEPVNLIRRQAGRAEEYEEALDGLLDEVLA